jgi:hypothetical protein
LGAESYSILDFWGDKGGDEDDGEVDRTDGYEAFFFGEA